MLWPGNKPMLYISLPPKVTSLVQLLIPKDRCFSIMLNFYFTLVVVSFYSAVVVQYFFSCQGLHLQTALCEYCPPPGCSASPTSPLAFGK